MWEAFAAFDTTGSGLLTGDEFLAILTRQGGGAALSVADAQAFVTR